ncbi:MAG TPA: ABC transporter permease [Vicinamibacterales bacterium]|nr:ABC transporter permease [Vicinamibacterales bacterium]
MKRLHDAISWGNRLLTLLRRGRRARDIDDEIAFHLAMRQAEHERDGLAPEIARRTAARQFGNITALKEQTRNMWTFPSFESFVQDLRYALRTLRRAPAFALVAVLVLAIGIGATTGMFSLVDAMLVRGLPYPQADRLVVLIGNVERAAGVERRGNSYPDHVDWRARATSFDEMAAYTTLNTTLQGVDEPEPIPSEAVSPPYFKLLGVSPTHGRVFRPEEDAVPNRDAVVILGDGLWRRRFGADPSIVGRTIQLGTRTFTVVGIMPAGFTGVSDTAQLWIPFAMSGTPLDNRGSRGFQTLARLKAGATLAEARAELDTISRQLAAAYPQTNDKRGVEVSPLADYVLQQLRPIVVALMAAVTLVLLIACANIAGLLIGRSDARQREIAVRTALGAGPGRLLRQLVTESCVLALLGALAGMAVAQISLPSLIAASPVAFPTFVPPQLSLRVLAFGIVIALLSGIILGLAPMMHTRLPRLGDALKTSSRGGSIGMRSQRLRSGLVIVEVALAVVLLAGAGLMIRSIQKLAAIDPGFEAANVLVLNATIPRQTAPPALPGAAAAAPAPFVTSHADLLDRVRAVPGVEAVSLASDTPFGGASAIFYSAEGDATVAAETLPRAYIHRVTPEFFATLRIRLEAGRTFLPSEERPDSPAVIVSHNVTRRFWPNQDPIGKRIKVGAPGSQNPWMTIVGVVDEVKYRGLPENPTRDPDLYLPYLDRASQGVLVRTRVEPSSVASAVRAAIRDGNASIGTFNARTLADLVAQQSSASRFTSWLLSVFAATALVLSVVGLYGVMSYLVAQRTREFGIRLALGASRAEIVRRVMRDGTWRVAIGAAIGLAATTGLARLLAGLVYGVGTFDISSLLAVATLVVVAIVACGIPAVRATRVDPAIALRSE